MIFEISDGISRQFESLTTSPMGIVSAEKLGSLAFGGPVNEIKQFTTFDHGVLLWGVDIFGPYAIMFYTSSVQLFCPFNLSSVIF